MQVPQGTCISLYALPFVGGLNSKGPPKAGLQAGMGALQGTLEPDSAAGEIPWRIDCFALFLRVVERFGVLASFDRPAFHRFLLK